MSWALQDKDSDEAALSDVEGRDSDDEWEFELDCDDEDDGSEGSWWDLVL
jgi:hypothetical protein